MKLRFLCLAILSLLSVGCSHVVFVRDPQHRISAEPVYESSRPFFFLGLLRAGEDVYLDKICLGRDVDQVSTIYTGKDFMSTVLTLGIYSPRSVRVWCSI